jgi:hypothetical protein
MESYVGSSVLVNVSELVRLLQQTSSLLHAGRKRFGDEGVVDVWSADVVNAIPQIKAWLEDLNGDTNSVLREDALSCLDWQTDHGPE